MSFGYAVLLYGNRIGHLTVGARERWAFGFTDEYRRSSSRPVLGQKFEDDLQRRYTANQSGRLPSFFANLVPEHGQLRDILVQSFGVNPDDDAALLEAVGRDLPGAVEIVRSDEFDGIENAEVENEHPVDAGAASTGGLRFSLAGVQLKFSMLREERGLTLPATGCLGDWIVKLATPGFPNLVENEFVMTMWARAAGFDSPECMIVPSDQLEGLPESIARMTQSAFAIRRYDRLEGTRIHQEDFAQVTGVYPGDAKYHSTYEIVGSLVRAIGGDEAFDEFVRRLVLVIAMGNNDAHLKNWSLFYPDRAHATLAPVYDQVCTIAYPEVDRELALKFAGSRSAAEIDERAFEHLARKAGADPTRAIRTVRETVLRLADTWLELRVHPAAPAEVVAAIDAQWMCVPALRDIARRAI